MTFCRETRLSIKPALELFVTTYEHLGNHRWALWMKCYCSLHQASQAAGNSDTHWDWTTRFVFESTSAFPASCAKPCHPSEGPELPEGSQGPSGPESPVPIPGVPAASGPQPSPLGSDGAVSFTLTPSQGAKCSESPAAPPALPAGLAAEHRPRTGTPRQPPPEHGPRPGPQPPSVPQQLREGSAPGSSSWCRAEPGDAAGLPGHRLPAADGDVPAVKEPSPAGPPSRPPHPSGQVLTPSKARQGKARQGKARQGKAA